MPLELITIPCLSDNYAFLLGDASTGRAILFDAPEASPINATLEARNWTLETVCLTHHHPDHIDGVPHLRGTPEVIGAAADAARLPPLDHALTDGAHFERLGTRIEVMDVPGHTIGHIAYHLPNEKLLFSGDSLMAAGCGRLFEGTHAQMWDSLQKLRHLHGDTRVCSGHEYTLTNLAFAKSLTPNDTVLNARIEKCTKARKAGLYTIPSLLSEECATNPFLRADSPEMAQALGMDQAKALDVFTHLRQKRDDW